jgi:nitrogen regulatory protein P-II 2
MKLVLAIIKPFKVPELVDAVEASPDFPGITVFDVRGFGREKTAPHEHVRAEDLRDFTDHAACLIATPDAQADSVVEQLRSVAHTGLPGDGKIFVIDLERAIRIGTGESGETALR